MNCKPCSNCLLIFILLTTLAAIWYTLVSVQDTQKYQFWLFSHSNKKWVKNLEPFSTLLAGVYCGQECIWSSINPIHQQIAVSINALCNSPCGLNVNNKNIVAQTHLFRTIGPWQLWFLKKSAHIQSHRCYKENYVIDMTCTHTVDDRHVYYNL